MRFKVKENSKTVGIFFFININSIAAFIRSNTSFFIIQIWTPLSELNSQNRDIKIILY